MKHENDVSNSSRWKPETQSRVFTDLLSNSLERLPRFSPGYEGTENMFYFVNEVSRGFSNITSTTACTRKLVNNSRAKFARDRILNAEQVPDFERKKN